MTSLLLLWIALLCVCLCVCSVLCLLRFFFSSHHIVLIDSSMPESISLLRSSMFFPRLFSFFLQTVYYQSPNFPLIFPLTHSAIYPDSVLIIFRVLIMTGKTTKTQPWLSKICLRQKRFQSLSWAVKVGPIFDANLSLEINLNLLRDE